MCVLGDDSGNIHTLSRVKNMEGFKGNILSVKNINIINIREVSIKKM